MVRFPAILIALAVIFATAPDAVPAQDGVGVNANGAAFEVARIRLHANPDDPSETNLLPGGRYEGRNVSVRKLIRLATGVDDRQLVGIPDWADSERYDIDAKMADTARLQPEVFQKALLALLKERFGLKFHREEQERPVFSMTAPRGDVRLKPHGGDSEPTMSVNGGGGRKVLVATGISMQDLAALLTRQAQRPVQDHTGLGGRFDVRLEWDESQSTDSGLPSLFGALEQLGLKLTAAKDVVEVFVVDTIQRPTEN